MTKVFIGGSRHASRLSAEMRRRIDNIIDRRFPIVIGDANGADKAIQEYLQSRNYQNVEIFCSDGVCRNNVGRWPTRKIPAGTRQHGAEFYFAKDRAMANEATVGLMMWDGKSLGTLLNVFRLLQLQKKVVIYTVPERRFHEVRSLSEWEKFLAGRDPELRQKIERRAKLEPAAEKQPAQASIFD